jgi:hypothetical protein
MLKRIWSPTGGIEVDVVENLLIRFERNISMKWRILCRKRALYQIKWNLLRY